MADDEASARSGLGTLLRDEGFDVTLAEDGSTALARVQESAPDVLVTDLRMPGMDGIELLRRAREVDPDLIVVLMTAFAEVETAVRAMQEGAEHYLTKPLQIDELVLVIRRALERRNLRNEATRAPRPAQGPLALRQHRRRQPGDAGGVQRRRAGRADQGERPHHRRERHRQGARRAGHPREQPPGGTRPS